LVLFVRLFAIVFGVGGGEGVVCVWQFACVGRNGGEVSVAGV
jgi:hypothetical protein